MIRLIASLAAAAAAALAVSGASHGAVFRIVDPAPPGLPGYERPNAPGSLPVPIPLDAPPAEPAVRSYEELLALWRRAGDAYGVPWQVLGAINKIESNFGRNMGPSSAGALGWMQFIPDSWLRWGLDADGDGVADPWDPEDAVFAAARYLAAAGAHEDLRRAVFAYNHADWYVEDVLELAAMFEAGGFSSGTSAAARADDVDRRLAAARTAVTRAQQAVPALERRIEELEWRRRELELAAGNPALSPAAFAAVERSAEGAAVARDRAVAALARARVDLDTAVAELEALRAEAAAAQAVAPRATVSVAAAKAQGDYVFPVGGGPRLVSVAHDHHDYPAADIAAPEGSPLYALASGVVADAFPSPNGRCGIGFKLRLDGGPVYVYCHLSYLEPSVVPGAALAAGAPVGLVGSTGNSTGPHLHLALVPALTYPQEEPWFRSFAGEAFSWQDAPTPKPRAAKRERVFRVVRTASAPPPPRVITFTR